MLDTLPCPAIIAHRGASASAPENTLAAFQLALEQNADAIELDTNLCRDQHVVVLHDQTVDRTTDGTGRVNQWSLAELKQLDAGAHFADQYRGERIPTLDEVLQSVGDAILINIELNNYATPLDSLAEKAAGLVKKHDLTAKVLFSSFNPLALIQVRRQLPTVDVALLAFRGILGAWARSWFGSMVPHHALHAHHLDVSARLVAHARRRKLRLHAYTVNEEEEMHLLFNLGIDGIFTDDPTLAHQVRGETTKAPAIPE